VERKEEYKLLNGDVLEIISPKDSGWKLITMSNL